MKGEEGSSSRVKGDEIDIDIDVIVVDVGKLLVLEDVKGQDTGGGVTVNGHDEEVEVLG